MATCRICLEDADPEADLAPCACKGSARFVHRACLERWALLKTDDECEICKQPYTIKLPRRWRLYDMLALAYWFCLLVGAAACSIGLQYFDSIPFPVLFGAHGTVVVVTACIWTLVRHGRRLAAWTRETLRYCTPIILVCVYGPQIIIDDLRDDRAWSIAKMWFVLVTVLEFWRHS